MDAFEQLQEDLRSGRIDANRLIDLLGTLQRDLQATRQRNTQLEQRNTELEHCNTELRQRITQLEKQQDGTTSAQVDQPFSLRAEEKRQEARGKKKRKPKDKGRRGRVRTADKIARAERTVEVYPDGVPPSDCWLSHTRPVWRLEQGRAVLVAYRVYRGPNNQYGKIPGVLGRSEFALEIVVAIAFQVYVVGLSFDKVCLLMNFFQNLKLSKSQADALLHQLARHWHQQFDVLCTLLANSLVVHTDETSWSINSVWTFLSEKARLLLFGVHKDAATLAALLDPATFAGLVISDDAAVYGHFTHAQKCWAHLLRKAIKLTLQEPDNAEYRLFTDRLLEIYRAACRVQRDGRLGDAGRARKVATLDDEIVELCSPVWLVELPSEEGPAGDYRRLVNEVMRLMLAKELFAFVTAKAVEQPNGATQAVGGTNNESERTLRNPATARKTGRTSKTVRGARRQTIVHSVLESLRLYLKTFTLAKVIEEVQGWLVSGRSCFEDLLKKLGLPRPDQSVLDQVLPCPGG
jgi:transposase